MSVKNIFGLGTKTISITAVPNKTAYPLADQQRLGLPKGAKVIGFGVRYNGFFGIVNDKSKNGNNLVTENIIQGTYLNIVGWSDRTIIAQTNLKEFSWYPNLSPAGFIEYGLNLIEPIDPAEISWSRSELQLSFEVANTLIPDPNDEILDFELNVYYKILDNTEFALPASQIYPDGQSFTAFKQQSLVINLRTGARFFPFTQDGKSGINEDAVIYGLKYLSYPFVPPQGGSAPDSTTLGSAFITLQAGRENILEDYPLRLLKQPPSINTPFFPIEPLRAGFIDFQSSEIYIADNTNTVTGQSIVLNFYYKENC